MMLEPRDPVLYFVQRLRDEAHRFAIGTHRAKRGKAIGANPLDEIAGIGPARKRALLKHFGSAKAVSRAGAAGPAGGRRHQRRRWRRPSTISSTSAASSRVPAGNADTGGSEQDAGCIARSERHLGIATHQRRGNGAVDEQLQLGRKRIGILHLEPLEQVAKPQPPLLLECDGQLVGGVPGLLQLGHRIDERAAAKHAAGERALEPIELAEDLLGRRQVGDGARSDASARDRQRSNRPLRGSDCRACAC